MEYGNAERCIECGEQMLIIPNPSPEMIKASSGYQLLKDGTVRLVGEFDPEDVRMGFCDPCGTTSIIGAQVTISGVVVGDD